MGETHWILVLEDDPLVARALLRALRALGDPRHAPSCAAARNLLADSALQTGLTAAVFDIELGDGSGLDVLAELRVRYPALPVVVLSGTRDPAAVVEARRLGAVFVAKPCPAARLCALLGETLRAPHIASGAYPTVSSLSASPAGTASPASATRGERSSA